MRAKIDLPDSSSSATEPCEKPYPSWNDLVSRLRQDRLGPALPAPETPQAREWRDLVADMILRR